MAHEVFISYSTKDKNASETVCSILEKNDISCWIAPRDITPGVPFAEAIIDAIKESKIFIIIYSSNSNQSSQVIKEVDRAVHHGLAIITLRLEDIPLSKQLEYYISNVHWLEAISSPLEPYIEQLSEVVQTLLSKKQPKDDDIEKAITDGTAKHKRRAGTGKISTVKKKKWIFVSGFLLIIAIVVASLLLSNIFGEGKNQEDGSIGSIIVLPFANYTGDESLETLVSGMHTCLITDIGRLGGLQVINPTTSNVYKNAGRPVHEIAEELNVEGAIEVSVLGVKDSVMFEVNLISTFPEEKTIWTNEYKEEKGKLLNLFNQLTKQIASELKVKITPEEEQLLEKTRIVNPDALFAYMKGQFHLERLGREDLDSAMHYFQTAIEEDPDWAEPYAGMGITWVCLGGFAHEPLAESVEKGIEYLNKALEMDPNSANSYYAKGLASVWVEWDWETGEQEFLKSLELQPNNALCRVYYAHLLMILKRFDEARHQANLALKLNPEQPLVLGLYAVVMNFLEDYQSAMAQSEKAVSIDPDNGFAVNALSGSYLATGDTLKWYEFSKGGWRWANEEYFLHLDTIFQKGGYIAVINDRIKVNEEVYSKGGIISYSGQGERYLITGDYEKAMDYFEKAYEERYGLLAYASLYVNEYPELKNNSRYIELMKKMNLPLP